jgi:hypothetical protein
MFALRGEKLVMSASKSSKQVAGKVAEEITHSAFESTLHQLKDSNNVDLKEVGHDVADDLVIKVATKTTVVIGERVIDQIKTNFEKDPYEAIVGGGEGAYVVGGMAAGGALLLSAPAAVVVAVGVAGAAVGAAVGGCIWRKIFQNDED